MGESVENKPVGTWFGPNTVLQVSFFMPIRKNWHNVFTSSTNLKKIVLLSRHK